MDELEHDMWYNNEELTPRPLRVIKREPKVTDSGTPSVSTGAFVLPPLLPQLPPLILSPVTGKPLYQVPRRTTSISSYTSTNFSSYSEVDEEALFSQAESSANSSTSLSIQKRIRNDAKNSEQEIGISSIGPSLSRASSTKTVTRTKASSGPSASISRASSTKTTIGTKAFSRLSFSVSQASSTKIASATKASSRLSTSDQSNQNRDAWSRSSSSGNDSTLQSGLSANTGSSYLGTSQQIPGGSNSASIGDRVESPSEHQHKFLKRLFLNRLVSEFTMGVSGPTDQFVGSSLEAELPRQARSASARKYTKAKLGLATTNSGNKQATLHNKTDKTVAPSPNSQVRVSRTRTSHEIFPQAVPPSPRLATPQENAVLGAKLTLTSERDCVSVIDAEHQSSFFVAIEVKGIVGSTSHGGDVLDESNALDIAIIVDNSLYTSPTSLLSSCDIASEVAATLDSSQDRLSLFKTSLSNGDSVQRKSVLPLCMTSRGDIKSALNSIMGSASQPQPDYMVDAIKQAQLHLMHDTATADARRHGRISFSHIILLSGNLDAVPDFAHNQRYTELHVICPSSVPRQAKPTTNGAGWRLHVASGPVKSVLPATSKNICDEIHAMVFHLRRHARAGTLTNLHLGIKPAPQCSIEGIMGKTRLQYLRPGEIHTVMVKVRMLSSQVGTDEHPQLPRTMSEALDAPKEIDAALCEGSVPLLEAKLAYTHTGLPEGTVCRTVSSIDVKLRNLDARQINASLGQSASQHEKLVHRASYVRRRLIHHLAIHHSPEHALQTILDQLDSEGIVPLCSEYLSLVIVELKYQSRINQRLEFANDQVYRAERPAKQSSTSQKQQNSEAVSQDLSTLAANDEDKLSFVGEESSDTESTEADRRANQASGSPFTHSTDPARQIWGDLRKAKGEDKHRFDGDRNPQSCDSNETLNQIKNLALKNKRSMGQDTLDSITFRRSRKENVAPWL